MSIPFVIINPNANSGKLGKRIDQTLRTIKKYLGDFEYKLTQGPRDEISIATEAINNGFNTILACGGDGTATNTGDAIINSGKPDIKLGLISGGSMCDWHKTHSIPFNLEDSLSIIADGHIESFPAMKCTGEKTYYSFEMADGGFTGAAAAAAHREVKWIKNGDIKYAWLALKYIIKSKNTKAIVTIDDREPIEIENFSNAAAAFGDEIAGFKVLPGNDYFSRKNKDLGMLIVHDLKGF
ncbi:MAG: diacylglycerol/lipid kinase family protein, partial [Candidatus Heimdallarchaeaceae archaeon]